MHGITPEQLAKMSGVDRLPMPADPAMLRTAMDRHKPRSLPAGGAMVTVDVTVDAQGHVTAVRPVAPATNPKARAVLRERDGSERTVDARRDPGIAPAAEAVLRDVRFTPALRDGEPVPHTFRMTVSFEPEEGERSA